jgi:hypothetical protein
MTRITPLSLVLSASLACGDGAVTEPLAMSPSEVITLFNEIAGALDATDTPFFLHESSPMFARHGGTPPETYNGEAECPNGGRVTNQGGGEFGEIAIDVTFTQSFDRCRTANFTTSGTLAVTAVSSGDDESFEAMVTVQGILTLTNPTGRRGTCEADYGYSYAVDPVAVSFQPTGTLCGFQFLQIVGTPLSFKAVPR